MNNAANSESKLTSLTDRQTKILTYINTYTFSNGYPPSVREIGQAVGLSSSASVHNNLKSWQMPAI